MTWLQNIINVLDSGLWKFVRIIHSANHDYPYHDHFLAISDEQENTIELHYTVGEKNIDAHGDQHKHFTSKRMIIQTQNEDTSIRLNHNNNVNIYIPTTAYDSTQSIRFHTLEIHTNVSEVFISLAAGDTIIIYCEGVLPQEARDAE